MGTKLKKRTWHYIYQPDHYECMCDADPRLSESWHDGDNTENPIHKITWSEFAGMFWCYTCEKDIEGFAGVLDGPVPFEATQMILGADCFDRWDMKKREVQSCRQGSSGNIYYKRDKARTAVARRNMAVARE